MYANELCQKGYRLGQVIGRGAEGVVQAAERTHGSPSSVVIKKRAMGSPSLAASCAMELQALETVHPNIVELLEYFVSEDGCCCFFVLERLQTDLFTFIQSQAKQCADVGALSEQQARPIFRDVASALAHMHSCNLSHNDVKPENVLLTIATDGSVGRAKLSDFGLSQFGMQLTSAVGTHEYMSPESLRLAEDELLGIRCRVYCAACSDAYALGVTLYVSLLGRYPEPWFDRRLSTLASTLASRRLPPDFVKQCNISREAQQLIASMMQYEPAQRATLSQVAASNWLRENDIARGSDRPGPV